MDIERDDRSSMQEITTFEDLMSTINNQKALLIYLSSPDCSVCHSDLPRVEEMVRRFSVPAVSVNVMHVPKAAGQLSVFTVPVVLLYYKGREYHREARIIDFAELAKRMQELDGQLFNRY